MNDAQIAMENEYKKVYNLFSEHSYTVESRSDRGFGDTVIDISKAVEITIDYCRESNKDGQDQALREIDIRIDEQNRILSMDYVSVKLDDVAYVDQDGRIKELQAKKDKLIKGVE